MVNIELYRVFYTVAKCGSLTRAAEELFISQPAVSLAIKQLESQLGTSLFNRTHRGMELSAQGGKLIYKQVEEALALLDGAENKLIELKTTASGVIRIGATDSIFSNILVDKIVAFNEKYPAVRVELITGTTPDTVAQLRENKCDIGFVNMPVEDKDIHFIRTIAHLSDVFVASSARYAALRGKKVALKDLQEYPLMMIESNTVARRAFAAFAQSIGLILSADIEVAGWELMLKLACKGMGIGLIPREYAVKELESGELFEVDITPDLPVRGVGMALPKNVPVSFALREFMGLFG